MRKWISTVSIKIWIQLTGSILRIHDHHNRDNLFPLPIWTTGASPIVVVSVVGKQIVTCEFDSN